MRREAGDCAVDRRGRDHQPYRTRFIEPTSHVLERGGGPGTFPYQRLFSLRRRVENYTLVALLKEPAHHIGPHSAKSNHPKLHDNLLTQCGSRTRFRSRPIYAASALPAARAFSKVLAKLP